MPTLNDNRKLAETLKESIGEYDVTESLDKELLIDVLVSDAIAGKRLDDHIIAIFLKGLSDNKGKFVEIYEDSLATAEAEAEEFNDSSKDS